MWNHQDWCKLQIHLSFSLGLILICVFPSPIPCWLIFLPQVHVEGEEGSLCDMQMKFIVHCSLCFIMLHTTCAVSSWQRCLNATLVSSIVRDNVMRFKGLWVIAKINSTVADEKYATLAAMFWRGGTYMKFPSFWSRTLVNAMLEHIIFIY